MGAMKKWTAGAIIIACAVGIALSYRSHAVESHRARAAESLETARLKLEQGKPEAAEDAVRWLAAEHPTEEALALLARSLDAQGSHDQALETWERLLKDYPKTGLAGEAQLAQARAAVRAKDLLVAKGLFEAIQRDYPATDLAAQAGLGLVDISFHEGDTEAARAHGLTLLDEPGLPDADRGQLEELLGRINVDMLYSRQPMKGDLLYTVEKGDYISKIARSNNISEELLMRVNNISDPKMLSVGHRIKIPQLNLKLVVDKSDNTMTVMSNGHFFKKYCVRTGIEEFMTPTGEFKILNKKENPQWTRPDTGEVVPPGDPTNELGTRWMAFEGSQLGIHGTIRPETLGAYASQGCVGMSMKDVEELYQIVPVGTPVQIVGRQNPELKKYGG